MKQDVNATLNLSSPPNNFPETLPGVAQTVNVSSEDTPIFPSNQEIKPVEQPKTTIKQVEAMFAKNALELTPREIGSGLRRGTSNTLHWFSRQAKWEKERLKAKK